MLTCIQACRLSVTKTSKVRERSGSCSGRVLDSRQRGRGFEPHRHHCVVSLSKNIYPSLVLVQPRKTRPFITEKLLMGRKESNQTNKQNKQGHMEPMRGLYGIFKVIIYADIMQTFDFLMQRHNLNMSSAAYESNDS